MANKNTQAADTMYTATETTFNEHMIPVTTAMFHGNCKAFPDLMHQIENRIITTVCSNNDIKLSYTSLLARAINLLALSGSAAVATDDGGEVVVTKVRRGNNSDDMAFTVTLMYKSNNAAYARVLGEWRAIECAESADIGVEFFTDRDRCAICGEPLSWDGFDLNPLSDDKELRSCDTCMSEVIIPVRKALHPPCGDLPLRESFKRDGSVQTYAKRLVTIRRDTVARLAALG